MATREIFACNPDKAPSGSLCYFTVRNQQGQRWNTDTLEFEEYDEDNWALYAIALTEYGTSGEFYGDLPAEVIALGVVVTVNCRVQTDASGDPSPDDVAFAEGDIGNNACCTGVTGEAASGSHKYATYADVVRIFGAGNVRKWADLENLGAAADEDVIAGRVNYALCLTAEKLDNRLRGGPYTIPLTPCDGSSSSSSSSSSSVSCYPLEVIDANARWAGVHLYDARGVTDINPVTGDPVDNVTYHRRVIRDFIKQVHAGQIVLDLDSAVRTPGAISWENYDSFGNYVGRSAQRPYDCCN